MQEGGIVVAIEEGFVAYADAGDGQRGGRDGWRDGRFGGRGKAWGQRPAGRDGGKVWEGGTGRNCSGKPKSKNEAVSCDHRECRRAEVLHPVFILAKARSVKQGCIRDMCDL